MKSRPRAPRGGGRLFSRRPLPHLAVLCAALAAVGPTSALGASESPGEPAEKAAVARPAADTWYAVSVSQSGFGYLLVHYWSKGPSLRAESVVGGNRIITLVHGDIYYALNANVNVGIAIKRSPAAVAGDAERLRPFAMEWKEVESSGGEKVRTESAGDVTFEVWRLTNQRGRREVWVTADESRLVARVVTFDRKSGNSTAMEYTDWLRGLVLPDSFFQPSSDVQLLEFELDDYLTKVQEGRPVGPVPVLYPSLLRGPR